MDESLTAPRKQRPSSSVSSSAYPIREPWGVRQRLKNGERVASRDHDPRLGNGGLGPDGIGRARSRLGLRGHLNRSVPRSVRPPRDNRHRRERREPPMPRPENPPGLNLHLHPRCPEDVRAPRAEHLPVSIQEGAQHRFAVARAALWRALTSHGTPAAASPAFARSGHFSSRPTSRPEP